MGSVAFTSDVRESMIAHCLDAYPYEACGVLARKGSSETVMEAVYPVDNIARSSRVYTLDPKGLLDADRTADLAGLEIAGVFHSHTHTEAYPSPTDVTQAPVPEWCYVIVSLAGTTAQVRAFRIVEGSVSEEAVL